MLLRKMTTGFVALIFSAGTFLSACSRPHYPLTSEEAKSLAIRRLKQEQNFWCYDASRLPPLRMEESSNQYVFTVDDPKQNVSVTVVVFKNGGVDDSAVDLDLEKAVEEGRNVVLRRTKTHCAEPNN
ncbi:MAG: hypothetical protein ACREHG_10035 [Candidatus Saccharimonadales bacterium]